jgi:hypothetical protein
MAEPGKFAAAQHWRGFQLGRIVLAASRKPLQAIASTRNFLLFTISVDNFVDYRCEHRLTPPSTRGFVTLL